MNLSENSTFIFSNSYLWFRVYLQVYFYFCLWKYKLNKNLGVSVMHGLLLYTEANVEEALLYYSQQGLRVH